MYVQRIIGGIVGLLLSACHTLMSYQTAEIVSSEKIVITPTASMVFSAPIPEENAYDDGNFLFPSLLIRKGISSKSEMNASIAPNAFVINYKHLWKNSQRFITSYSFGAGYFFLASSRDDQYHIIDFPWAFYSTLKVAPFLNLTLIPKAMPRLLFTDAASQTFTFLGGSSFNIAIGKTLRFFPEAGVFFDVGENNWFYYGGLGVEF